MSENPLNETAKREIIEKIGRLSRLLGMIPSDDSITLSEPVTLKSMTIAKWFDESRDLLLSLSLQLDKALDLHIQ